MILYSSYKTAFINDINDKSIIDILNNKMKEKMYHYTSESEKSSWENSLEYISEVISSSNLPDDCTIILEYNLPISSSRIDLMITGFDEQNNKKVLLFELKQWSKANIVPDSNILLETYVGNTLRRVVHPAYQVITYRDLLCDYNKYIQDENVLVIPCVIMHNYVPDNIINSSLFSKILKDVNIFYKEDFNKLVEFINCSFIKGDNGQIINSIDRSEFYPSKKLQDAIKDLMDGKECFKLIDSQMVIYDELLRKIDNSENSVSIIDGGPGTGKSVIAINLLVEMINQGKMAQYVSRNTAPRAIYSYELKGTINKNSIDNLFKTSGSYTSVDEKIFDCLIVDEAHCLTEKSGLFNNYGENQIKEIIKSSKHSVFFIDEKQKVHLNDIGTIDEIEKWANIYNKKIYKYSLLSQFRCNNSGNYLDFVDYILGIKNDFEGNIGNYEFKMCDSPNELKKIIEEKNKKYKARIIAGYCWNWDKKEIDNSDYHDIKIGDFGISWNLGAKQTFAVDDSINEAGCIHSVQGLEFDYVGIIIGNDLLYKNNKLITDFHNHASTDPSFKGIRKLEKEDSPYANLVADKLIRNIYRVLLTRGIKGCYVYCVDESLNNYFKNLIKQFK